MRGLLGGSYLACMATLHRAQAPTQRFAGEDARERLLSGLPVTERRLQLAGVSTAVLEGGDGPPMVLLAGGVRGRVDAGDPGPRHDPPCHRP